MAAGTLRIRERALAGGFAKLKADKKREKTLQVFLNLQGLCF